MQSLSEESNRRHSMSNQSSTEGNAEPLCFSGSWSPVVSWSVGSVPYWSENIGCTAIDCIDKHILWIINRAFEKEFESWWWWDQIQTVYSREYAEGVNYCPSSGPQRLLGKLGLACSNATEWENMSEIVWNYSVQHVFALRASTNLILEWKHF